MKKICFLETSPSGFLDNHKRELVDTDLCDHYFITHDSRAEGAIGFFPGGMWAENRNRLKDLVPKEYEYYAFIDYDVILSSRTHRSVVEQLICDLEILKPAVLVPFDPDKKEVYEFARQEYFPVLCSYNQLKIYHHSLLEWFFPIPTAFGQLWGACHFNNVMEYPFKDYVVCTKNVFGPGFANDPRNRPRNGKQGMVEIHDWVYSAFRDPELKRCTTHEAYKQHCLEHNRSAACKTDHGIVDFLQAVPVGMYFDLDHECFDNRGSK